MKFETYLNELFDTDIKIKFTKSSKDFYDFRFVVDGKEYSTEIYKMSYARFSGEDEWVITFFDNEGGEEITSGGGKNVFKIFAGVIKCIKMLLKKEKPSIISFSAKESSRRKLYDKLSSLIIKQTNYIEYKTKEKSIEKEYLFKRK